MMMFLSGLKAFFLYECFVSTGGSSTTPVFWMLLSALHEKTECPAGVVFQIILL